MKFPKADDLKTLSEAREAFLNQIAAHKHTLDELDAVKGDLQAANEMLEEAAQEKAKLAAELEQSGELLATTHAAMQEKEADLARAASESADLRARIGQLEAEAKSAEAKAAQICASVGVDPVKVSPRVEAEKPSLLAQMRSIENPAEQMAFFRKNKEAILRGE